MDMPATIPPASTCLHGHVSIHVPSTAINGIATSNSTINDYASASNNSSLSSPSAFINNRRHQAGGIEPDGDEGDAPRPRLSREQVLLLEKQFSENPKPTATTRWAVAQRTGLSMQRVGNWFQNRRVKAKLQKRQEEMQVMQVLESAGRRRMTEPSTSTSTSSTPSTTSSTLSLHTEMNASKSFKSAAGRRRAKSESATARLNGRSSGLPTYEKPDLSPYASPTEASYASLARSLAQAAAAMQQASLAGGFNEYTHEIPKPALSGLTFSVGYNSGFALQGSEAQGAWQQPKSAFSDWGSNRSSIVAYTPTPAGQTEDPFEFDNNYSDPSQPASVIHSSGVSATEDFDMFAEAIKQNQTNRPFIMPAFSTSGLMKRRQMSPLCAEPQNTSSLPSPPLVDGCEAGQPQFSGFFNAQRLSLSSPSESGVSIAARRHQEGPTYLDSSLSPGMPVRSKSFNGTLSTMDEDLHEDEPSRRSVPSSKQDLQCMGADITGPFNLNIFSNAPAFSSKLHQSSGPPPDYSSPNSNMEEHHELNSSSPYTMHEHMPDLGFTDSSTPESATFSVTPESATFDNSILSSLPPTMLQDNYSVYRMHLPDHQQLFKHNGYVPYYDFPSEGSSASSGILLGKETNAFPFEDFLTARFKAKSVQPMNDEGY